MNESKQNRGRLQIIIAMVTFGTIGAFAKNIPLAPAEIALYRAIIAFFCLSIFLLFRKNGFQLTQIKGKTGRLFLSGVAIGVDWILLFEAYERTSVALATLSYYFAPTVVIIASAIFFKERLTVKQVICFIASTIGLAFVINVNGSGSSDLTGVLYGLGAALFYAAIVMFNKAAGEIDAIVRTWVQLGSAFAVLLPYVLFTSGFHIAELNSGGWFSLLFVGIVHTGIMYCLYFTSLSHLKGQQAAILSYIDPMVAILVSVFWLNEPITLMQLTGGAIILVFTMINELKIVEWKKSYKRESKSSDRSPEDTATASRG